MTSWASSTTILQACVCCSKTGSSLSGLLGGLCSISPSLQTGVQLDATYRALSQQRHQQANERTRTVQRVDAKDILTAQRNARLREPASMKSAIKRNVGTVMSVLLMTMYDSLVHDAAETCSDQSDVASSDRGSEAQEHRILYRICFLRVDVFSCRMKQERQRQTRSS